MLWNVLLLLINVILSIPLFLALIPTRLSPFQKEVYNNTFSSFFTKKQFKKFISSAELISYKAPTTLCSENNQISHYYFFVNVPNTARVEVKKRGQLIGTVESNSWVGIVDAYTQLEEGNRLDNLTWDVTCEITKADPSDPIKVYHFSVKKLNKNVFSSKGGMYIRQCVYALWLEDCMGGM